MLEKFLEVKHSRTKDKGLGGKHIEHCKTFAHWLNDNECTLSSVTGESRTCSSTSDTIKSLMKMVTEMLKNWAQYFQAS